MSKGTAKLRMWPRLYLDQGGPYAATSICAKDLP